jgi:hypothetical protein
MLVNTQTTTPPPPVWAIAAGLPTFEIAATMGTSLEQLSATYRGFFLVGAPRFELGTSSPPD